MYTTTICGETYHRDEGVGCDDHVVRISTIPADSQGVEECGAALHAVRAAVDGEDRVEFADLHGFTVDFGAQSSGGSIIIRLN
jgi:hypothetical protein